MSRTPDASERTPALHNKRTYSTESPYSRDYLSSPLVEGIVDQIADEKSSVTRSLITDIIGILDQSDGGIKREQTLAEFPGQRGPASFVLDRLRYFCITLEAEKDGETIVGLHPNEEQAARRGYEADRTRAAVLE